MLILVHNELLSDSTCWRDLDSLLDRARHKRCYVDALDQKSVPVNDWLNQLDKRRRADWMTATDWAARDAAVFRLRPIVAAKTSDSSRNQLKLIDAIRLVDRPKKIWVENDRNDRRFWLSMMPTDQRDMFLDFEKRGIFEFSSRGGLDELRASLNEQVRRGAASGLDSWVLFDSDGEVPGQRSTSAAAMVRFCEASGLSYHCLNRRAIENYIPRAALWYWVHSAAGERRNQRRKLIKAYQDMSSDQQQHYHMKSGWPQTPSTQSQLLYAGMPPKAREVLKDGIANDIASLYDTCGPSIYQWAKSDGIDSGVMATQEALTNWMRVPYA